MLSAPTLFVVGAGASAELNFPVGTELRDKAAAILELQFAAPLFVGLDQAFADSLAEYCQSSKTPHHDVWNAACSVSRALPLSASVDSYLDSHLGNPLRSLCCKAAIARVISTAENESALVCNSDRQAYGFDFKPVANTWYQRLWSILQTGVTPNAPERAFEGLAVITFNYDRNIERFLQLAFANFFDRRLDEALTVVNRIPMVHVYGSLGELEPSPDTCKSYRSTGYTINLFEAAAKISTYSEQVKSQQVERIRHAVLAAERIVFIGFSFGAANMDLFQQAAAGEALHKAVYATARGMSDQSREHTRTRLDAIFGRNRGPAEIWPDSACQFFDRFSGVFDRML